MPDPSQGPEKIGPKGPAKLPEEKPEIGQGQTEQKPFQMPSSTPSEGVKAPSPMEVAAQQKAQPVSPEELSENVRRTQQALQEAHNKLSDPTIQKALTEEHHKALRQVSTKLNGDLRTIAENSNGKFQPPVDDPKKSAVDKMLDWVNGSQSTLTGALNYLSETKKPNIASYMKMQYAVQRATQRAELFSSVVSSSVSGIKTLMSTQLG